MGRPVVQFQILSKDPERAQRFYTQLFDWNVNADNPLGYRVIDTGSPRGIQGGIWPSPPEGHSFVQLFVEVDDCTAHVRRAVELGAHVVVPPARLPQGEMLAVIVDPEGIAVGLTQPAPR